MLHRWAVLLIDRLVLLALAFAKRLPEQKPLPQQKPCPLHCRAVGVASALAEVASPWRIEMAQSTKK
jgi:hypothetical protein